MSISRRWLAIDITAGGIILAVFGAILSRTLNLVPDSFLSAHAPAPATASNSTTSGTTIVVTGSQQPTQPATSTDTNPAPRAPDPKGAAASVTEGKKLADEGDLRGAYEAYDRATKADPSSAFAWANLGGAAAKLGRPAEAAQAYQRSLAIDPDNWLAHYNLGCLFARVGKRDEAYGHVERAVDQLRRHVRSPSELESFMESIRTDEALKELHNDRRFTALLAAN